MRPDENPVLIAMRPSEKTCDKCITELYPNEDPSVCDDCKLNSAKNGGIEKFIEESAKREFSLPVKEVLRRHEIMNKQKKAINPIPCLVSYH